MFKAIKKLFTKPIPLNCGGVGQVNIFDKNDKVTGTLFYTLPTANQKAEFMYLYQNICDRTVIKKLKEAKNPQAKLWENAVEDNVLPFAKNIFLKSEGYCINGDPIDDLEKDKQYEIIGKYYSHHIIKMVEIAFDEAYTVKKKS